MDTKLTNTVYIKKEKIEADTLNDWVNFLNGQTDTFIEDAFVKVEALLQKSHWVVMNDDLVYDNKIKAAWLGLCSDKYTKESYIQYKTESELDTAVKEVNKHHKSKYSLDAPTREELLNSLTNLTVAPFVINDGRPLKIGNQIFKVKNKIEKIGTDRINDPIGNIGNIMFSGTTITIPSPYGSFIPLLRLFFGNNFSISNREVFFRWIVLGLIPIELKNDKEYLFILDSFNSFDMKIDNFFDIKKVTLKTKVKITLSSKFIIDDLLTEDYQRADIKPYHEKMLDDTEQGHWSLWDDEKSDTTKGLTQATLTNKLVARDPKSSIINGTVGIDFGTKSTVVVYQKDTTKIYPMRIGTGDLSKTISANHYENPTIMEFNDLGKFMENYKNREGRPYTRWEDLTISHTASNSLLNSKSDDFNSFINELKQWAGDKNKKLKMVDKNGYVLDLPPFLELKEDDINPIEIYAYYLGLYINNQHNGIYMNYILSFPVTYELNIRDKIIESFYKGIKKSLPQELHNQPKELEKLSILKGASEPAAYAVVALQEYDFDPCDDEKVFYGVFDFGGGTTDFDFGIFREANGAKERRYDYAIEHFGAGGDRYLGGENILELLAFEVFKKNKETLLKDSIQFILPPECDEFLGSETLLSLSREAKMNTKTLMEKLRAFWEGVEEEIPNYENGSLSVNLTNIEGKQLVNFELEIDLEELKMIIYNRIDKGVKNFFHSLRIAFENYNVGLNTIEEINIFLAGNSSKSILVTQLFDMEIQKQTALFNESQKTEKELFKIFAPLGSEDENLEKPTGKTGVAFGLIETRKGGDILVIDHNTKDKKDINFKYYLGESRKKKFKVIVHRDKEYNKWVEFIDASQDSFELYYSSQSIVTTNQTAIDDNSIKKVIIKTDTVDEDAFVYIRVVSPTQFEYVVANESEIESQTYLGNITKIDLKD